MELKWLSRAAGELQLQLLGSSAAGTGLLVGALVITLSLSHRLILTLEPAGQKKWLSRGGLDTNA